MEEVIGSIPIRSTKYLNNLAEPLPNVWQQIGSKFQTACSQAMSVVSVSSLKRHASVDFLHAQCTVSELLASLPSSCCYQECLGETRGPYSHLRIGSRIAWTTQADRTTTSRYCAKGDLVDELGFCMLGGFGITAELATAAFVRCRDAGLFDQLETRTEVWLTQLSEPLQVDERFIKYRYPNQKAKFQASDFTASPSVCACGIDR
jgi:hypothetical protein